MKLQIMSDLHFEFFSGKHKEFVNSLPIVGDVLIVAGDVVNRSRLLVEALDCLAKRFPNVLYVPGNHDYWGEMAVSVGGLFEHVEECNDNLVVLRNQIESSGQWSSDLRMPSPVLRGTTLWFSKTGNTEQMAYCWSDFNAIKEKRTWIYNQNKLAKVFLNDCHPGDIVVTHHLPSYRSVPARFKGEIANCFFVCDMEQLILEKKPKLWIHGHTHDSCDYTLGETRIVCNPLGYYGTSDQNKKFDPGLVIEV